MRKVLLTEALAYAKALWQETAWGNRRTKRMPVARMQKAGRQKPRMLVGGVEALLQSGLH